MRRRLGGHYGDESRHAVAARLQARVEHRKGSVHACPVLAAGSVTVYEGGESGAAAMTPKRPLVNRRPLSSAGNRAKFRQSSTKRGPKEPYRFLTLSNHNHSQGFKGYEVRDSGRLAGGEL